MRITLLFATHNGAFTLPIMFEHLLKMHIPDNLNFSIVAVCNACTDNSEDIIRSFSGKISIKIINEAKPGKNIALNSGLKSIDADAVIIADDDIIVDKNWLKQYRNTFESQQQFDIFGGSIRPHWLEAKPDGLTQAIPIEMAYALTATGYVTGPIKATKLFGPNMAIRNSVLKTGFTFDESIGPSSDNKNYVTGSETEFLKRCEAAGHLAYFNEECVVHHIIRPWQTTQAWLNNRALKGGKSVVQMQVGSGYIPSLVPLLFGLPRWALLKALKLKIKILIKSLTLNLSNEQRYKLNWELFATLGYAIQYKRLLKDDIIKKLN